MVQSFPLSCRITIVFSTSRMLGNVSRHLLGHHRRAIFKLSSVDLCSHHNDFLKEEILSNLTLQIKELRLRAGFV